MSTLLNSRPLLSLRGVLLVDAAACAVMGAILTPGSSVLAEVLAIPALLLLGAGLSLFPIAAVMAIVALRPALHRPGAWLVIGGNVLWVAGSGLLLLSGWIAPNPLGAGFIAAQALVVAALAKLEHDALPDKVLALRAG